MNPKKHEKPDKVVVQNDSHLSNGESLEGVLHSKLPELEAFIASIRDSKTEYESDYDRDGAHDRTYDRDSDVYDRGTFDRTQ